MSGCMNIPHAWNPANKTPCMQYVRCYLSQRYINQSTVDSGGLLGFGQWRLQKTKWGKLIPPITSLTVNLSSAECTYTPSMYRNFIHNTKKDSDFHPSFSSRLSLPLVLLTQEERQGKKETRREIERERGDDFVTLPLRSVYETSMPAEAQMRAVAWPFRWGCESTTTTLKRNPFFLA